MEHSKLYAQVRDRLVSRGLPPETQGKDVNAWVQANVPGLARLMDFMHIIHQESDRGCAICATAFIDDALQLAIRAFLADHSGASKSLLDTLLTKRPMPPLGSLAVRTKMARALGLIDDKIMAGLDAARSMRNDAAHLALPFSFDNYTFSTLFDPLSEKEQIYLQAIQIVAKEELSNPNAPKMRRVFELAATSIYFRLNLIAEKPSFHAGLNKIGGDMSHIAPFDKKYDELMSQSPPESGSSEDKTSSEQT